MTTQRARILQPTNLRPAIDALRNSDVVAIPTETVYGLAGNAFDATAVTKIFSAKERPSFDPLIVHVAQELDTVEKLSSAGIIDISRMSPAMTDIANRLIKTFWPGPLTLILPKGTKVMDLVTSGLDQVGVRMPAHPVAQDLLRAAQMPLAAPSANRFGRISPTRAEHVLEELGDRIPYIIDGGACDVGVESTVLAIESAIQPRLILLRPGKITASDIEHATSISVERASSTHEKASPGMLASHYAPRKNLYIIADWADLNANESALWRNKKIGLLVTSGSGQNAQQALAALNSMPTHTVYLSANGQDSEAAQKLFAGMRELDNSEADIILATAAPNGSGLWPAIADRLKRASTR